MPEKMGSGPSPEKERPSDNEIEMSILSLKYNGLPDREIIRGLENPPSGRQGLPREEIDRAFQRLRDYGFLDNKGLVTQEGIDHLKDESGEVIKWKDENTEE